MTYSVLQTESSEQKVEAPKSISVPQVIEKEQNTVPRSSVEKPPVEQKQEKMADLPKPDLKAGELSAEEKKT